jgi:hypothetical protein
MLPMAPDQSACNEVLGNISVLFDLIFIFQHFGLHRERLAENKPGLSEQEFGNVANGARPVRLQ